MKKNLYLTAAAFFLSFITASIVQSQWLTDKEKNALLAYWASESKLSAFSTEAKQTVLNNSANVRDLKPCAVAVQQFKVLNDASNSSSKDETMVNTVEGTNMLYDKINANFQPHYTKKVFPYFNKKECMNSAAQCKKIEGAGGSGWWLLRSSEETVNEVTNFSETEELGEEELEELGKTDELKRSAAEKLKNAYIKMRNGIFSKENAFTALEFEHPEAIKELENKLNGKRYQGIKRATNLSNIGLIYRDAGV